LRRESLRVYYLGVTSSLRHTRHVKILALSNIEKIEREVLILDSMLGKLARWLRILGFKVSYSTEIEDSKLALAESTVVTRDEDLAYHRFKYCRRTIFLLTEDLKLQLASVLRLLRSLPPKDKVPVIKYCSLCGSELLEISPDSVSKLELSEPVPDTVLKRYSKLWYCPTCRKLYWPGSHHHKIRMFYNNVLQVSMLLDRVCVYCKEVAPIYLLVL